MLYNIQQQFSNAILHNDSADLSFIKSTRNISQEQRIDIYRSASITAKISCLRQIYPICEMIIGDNMIKRMAYDYAISAESPSHDLNVFSEPFYKSVSRIIELHKGMNETPYLADLCRLEWLWHNAYYQANDDDFDFKLFSEDIDNNKVIKLNVSHSLSLMSTRFPIKLIWQQHRIKQSNNVEPLQNIDYLCVFRQV